MPSSSFVFGNLYVAFSARICCRSLPRFRSLFRDAYVRRVRYPHRCSGALLSVSSPLFVFVRFWLRCFSVRSLSRFVGIVSALAYLRYRSRSYKSSLSFGRCALSFRFRISLVRVRALCSYIVLSRAEDNTRLRALLRSFILMSLPLRFGSFRSIVVRLLPLRFIFYVWNFPLSLYRLVVVLLRLFVSSTLVAFVSRLSFSYRRFVGTSLSCTVRMSVSEILSLMAVPRFS